MKIGYAVLSLSIFVMGNTQAAQYVFPENGQSAEQQQQDEYYCHSWATKQTGYAPTGAQQNIEAEQGTGARGAIRGALGGLLLSEIVDGDNGNAALAGAVVGGVRGRRASVDNQQAQSAGRKNDYFRARAACLEAKGYSVK